MNHKRNLLHINITITPRHKDWLINMATTSQSTISKIIGQIIDIEMKREGVKESGEIVNLQNRDDKP